MNPDQVNNIITPEESVSTPQKSNTTFKVILLALFSIFLVGAGALVYYLNSFSAQIVDDNSPGMSGERISRENYSFYIPASEDMAVDAIYSEKDDCDTVFFPADNEEAEQYRDTSENGFELNIGWNGATLTICKIENNEEKTQEALLSEYIESQEGSESLLVLANGTALSATEVVEDLTTEYAVALIPLTNDYLLMTLEYSNSDQKEILYKFLRTISIENTTATTPEEFDYVPGEVLVTFEDGVYYGDAQELFNELSLTYQDPFRAPDISRWTPDMQLQTVDTFLVEVEPGKELEYIQLLSEVEIVRSVGLNQLLDLNI